MSYKNRQKKHEYAGKTIKEQIYVERNYAKEEIRQALEEHEQGEGYRYTIHNKRVYRDPTKEAIHRTKVRIEREKKWIRIFSGFSDNGWLGSSLDRMRHDLRKYTEKLKNLLTNNKK